MKTFLKILVLVYIALYFIACAPKGAQGGSSSTLPDVAHGSVHSYAVGAATQAQDGRTNRVSMHRICNFSFADVRDDSNAFAFFTAVGMGGDACENFTIEVKNVGAYAVILSLDIDGVDSPNEIKTITGRGDTLLLPGQTFNFQRGL